MYDSRVIIYKRKLIYKIWHRCDLRVGSELWLILLWKTFIISSKGNHCLHLLGTSRYMCACFQHNWHVIIEQKVNSLFLSGSITANLIWQNTHNADFTEENVKMQLSSIPRYVNFQKLAWNFHELFQDCRIWETASPPFQMFGTPYYCGLLPEQSYMLNRRSDSGEMSHRIDIRTASKKSKKSEQIYDDINGVGGSGARDELDSGLGTGSTAPRKISKFGSTYYEGVVTVGEILFFNFAFLQHYKTCQAPIPSEVK